MKIGIPLFGIFIFLFSCQKDTIEDFKETAQERKVKRIALSTLNSRHGKSNDFIKLSSMFDINKTKGTDFQQRLEISDNPFLMTDEIIMIEKEGATFYTFRVGTQTESANFYNLVVVFDDIGNILSTRVLEYIPNEIWLADTTQPFFGEVKSQENEFFSVEEINNLFSARSSGQCITGVSYIWNCGANNDHPPGHASCTPDNNAETEIIGISIQYGACPPELTQGDDGGYPVDTNPGGGGGGGSGSGTSNNNDNNDCVPAIDNPCEEDETAILIPIENDNNNICEELVKLLADFSVSPPLKSPFDAITYLQNNLDSRNEQGFSLFNNSNNVYRAAPTIVNGLNFVKYRTEPNVFGGMHLHQDDNKSFPMFSGQDILNLLQFYNQYNNGGITPASLPVVVLVTFQGVYAIKIEDLASLQQLQPILNDYDDANGDGVNEYEDFYEKLNKRYNKHTTTNGGGEPVINGSPVQYQNDLLKYINDYDGNGNSLGISLYKANSDLTNWDKLSLNRQVDYPPVKKSCN